VAHPPAVHGHVLARRQALDLVVPLLDVHAAAGRAVAADRLGSPQEPDARLVNEISIEQSADGADVSRASRKRVVQRDSREDVDVIAIAALDLAELARARDPLAEADAARAVEAA